MIVGLAGRKSTGKSTISNILLNKGFRKASFAAPLKEYVAKLYNWDVGLLNSQEGKEELLPLPVVWNQDVADRLSDIIGGGIKIIVREARTFSTRREALQYIGTDVLREIDVNFHVNEFKKKYSDGRNYVCDDLRFPNELEALTDMGSVCMYLMRPYCSDYSNHASESSLKRTDFKYVFLNDQSERDMIERMGDFFDFQFNGSDKPQPFSREDALKALADNTYNIAMTAKALKCRDKVFLDWCRKLMVNTEVQHNEFSIVNNKTAYYAGIVGGAAREKKGENFLKLMTKDYSSYVLKKLRKFLKLRNYVYPVVANGKTTYYLTIASGYVIDDLKFWDVDVNQNGCTKIPSLIRDNKELVGHWLMGVVDISGYVKEENGRYVASMSFATEDVAGEVQDWLGMSGDLYQTEDNFWTLQYIDDDVVLLHDKTNYSKIGLRKNWEKFDKKEI
jgi:hypothetical protein